MRQQLISWLTDEIAPEAKRSKDAPGAILKFAREHNLNAAQVEALGQLYNTAKTLIFLEKNASNRGADFPILDVEKLVQAFMETDQEKSASAFALGTSPSNAAMDGWNTHGVPVEFDDLHPARISDAFRGVTIPMERAHSMESLDLPLTSKCASAHLASHADQMVSSAENQILDQIAFDAREDMRKIAGEVEVIFRQNPDLSFQAVEADAWALLGEEMRPALNKIAGYLKSRNVRIERATKPRAAGLVRDDHGLMKKFSSFQELSVRADSATHAKKAATATADDLLGRVQDAAPGAASPSGGRDIVDQVMDRPSRSGGGGGGGGAPPRGDSPGKSNRPSAPGQPKGREDYFGQVGNTMDSIVSPALKEYEGRARDAFKGTNNTDQRKVDHGFRDVQQLAMLQQLMLTDEVLSEADPEAILSMYNTIRRVAPEMASDSNIMRVALRTAIQHDGISPFDIKSFAETELANQKVDLNRRQLDSHLYKGAPLGPKPAGS